MEISSVIVYHYKSSLTVIKVLNELFAFLAVRLACGEEKNLKLSASL